jgi:hypothetical protein
LVDRPEAVVKRRLRGVHPQRLSDRTDRLVVVSQLVGHDTPKMKRIPLVGRRLKDFAIDPLCLPQPARPMMVKRDVEQLIDGRGR